MAETASFMDRFLSAVVIWTNRRRSLWWRHKCPGVTIRVGDERFGAPTILSWLLYDSITCLPCSIDDRSRVADIEMGIHSESLAFAVRARFFPIPAAAPEKDTDVVRFQCHKILALGFETKTKEIPV